MKTKLLGLPAGIGIYALAAQPAAAVSITLNASGSGADAAANPIVGAGLPGLVAACVVLLALARRRRKR
jgi:hypothetical protein